MGLWAALHGEPVNASGGCLSFGIFFLAGRLQPRRRTARASVHALRVAVAKAQVEQAVNWCALYINLTRRPDRRERLFELLAVTNWELLARIERVDAVDGKQLSIDDASLEKIVSIEALDRARQASEQGAWTIVHDGGRLLHFDNHLTRGGIACAMSHRLALEKVAQHPTAEWGIILEDDVVEAVPRAHEVINKLVAQLPSDWDAVFLGYHDDHGSIHTNSKSDDASGPYTLPSVRLLHEPLFGLFAWVVRREAAIALLDGAFPIGGQVDHALSQWLVRERGRTYAVTPESMLFFSLKSEVGEDSDVQTMATVDAMLSQYDSWAGYYGHIWGIEGLFDDNSDAGFEYDDDTTWLTSMGFEQDWPACEAPTPSCWPTDTPENW